jgi:hypothetical protein
MVTKSNKWWWAGYAALVWSLLLALPLYSPVAFSGAIWLTPIGLLFCFSALRRGSPLAKGAAVAALIIALLYLFSFGTIRKWTPPKSSEPTPITLSVPHSRAAVFASAWFSFFR